MLELTTLGTLDLSRDGERVLSVLSQPTRLALLTYLAVAEPRGPHRRDTVTFLLWPDREDARARRALRQTLHLLRRSLGREVLTGFGGDSVGLAAGALRCDAVTFDEALDQGRPAEALDLYGGPFLKGFHLPDTREFEAWVEGERRRLGRRAKEAAWELVDGSSNEDPDKAMDWARRAIELDPYDESGWRRLFALMERGGDRAGAVRAYERLAARLEAELGMEPSAETRTAVENIRGSRQHHRDSSEAEQASPSEYAPAARQRDVADEEASFAAAITHSAGEMREAGPTETGRFGSRTPSLRSVLITVALVTIAGLASFILSNRWGGGESDIASSADPASAELPAGVIPDSAELANDRPTLAVLPFTNVGDDPEDEYLSDGLTEELIVTLAGIRALQVAARTSVFAFKGEERDVREIGELLGVSTVLEGSVRRDGDRLRITAQLIDATNGFHLWSESYERAVSDIFDIQTELALRIADAMEAELTPAERERASRAGTAVLDAHTLYLKGRYFWNRRTHSGLLTAIGYFGQSIEADPEYAEAYAGLASAYVPLAELGYRRPNEIRDSIREAATRALEIDPELPEGHTALGTYLFAYEWEWEAAERHLQRAIALDRDNTTAHHWYAYMLSSQGRFEESMTQRKIAIELDPLIPILHSGLGDLYRLMGHYDLAMASYRESLEFDPTFWHTHRGLGELHEKTGNMEEAVRSLERSVSHAGPTPRPKAGLARALARAGREDEARQLVQDLQGETPAVGGHDPKVATALLALGEKEAALQWLEAAYRERQPHLQRIAVAQGFTELHENSRFQDLVRRLGLR